MLGLLGWRCTTDGYQAITPKTADVAEKIEIKDPVVEDGVLIFQDRSHFDAMLIEHKSWSDGQRLDWEESIGFTSQYSQFVKILNAEEKAESEYYQSYLDEGMSVDEILSLDISKHPHSNLYLEAIEKGWVIVHEDSDTADVYIPNSPIPYCSLLGLEGFIMIGDTLSHYTNNQIKHWIGGKIENRHLLLRKNQTRLEEGIMVSKRNKNDITRASADWGTASYWYRWEYSADNKHRGAYQLRGWASDFGVYQPTYIEVEHWFEIHAQNKNIWGNWKARRSYRPDFHFAGTWSTRWAHAALGSNYCFVSETIDTDWCSNTLHNSSWLPPINGLVVPADNTQWQYEMLYPRGIFKTDCDQEWFCQLYRAVYVDVNIHVNGDGGGNIDLGRHIYHE